MKFNLFENTVKSIIVSLVLIGAKASASASHPPSEKVASKKDLFPQTLHKLLHYADEQGLNHVVSWLPSDRAFMVHNENRFIQDVFPLFFRGKQYSSFIRQLNLYGFKRISNGYLKGGGFHHEHFTRFNPCFARIRRLYGKSDAIRSAKQHSPRSVQVSSEIEHQQLCSAQTLMGIKPTHSIMIGGKKVDGYKAINTKNINGTELTEFKEGGFIGKDVMLEASSELFLDENDDKFLLLKSIHIGAEAKVYGDAWVYGNAKVYQHAEVSEKAKVYGNAQVFGAAIIFERAEVYGSARINGTAWVYGKAQVYEKASVKNDAEVFGKARLYGRAEVTKEAMIFGNAKVFGKTWISDSAKIYGNAEVFGHAWIYEQAQIYENAKVHGNAQVAKDDHVCGNSELVLKW